MTVRCPACTSPLRLEDLTFRDDHHGHVSTMGQVHLLPHTVLTGILVCGRFASHGRFDGKAMVHGEMALGDQSFTAGEIHARSLSVEAGANLRAKASISPLPLANMQGAIPSPAAGHRLLSIAPPRPAR